MQKSNLLRAMIASLQTIQFIGISMLPLGELFVGHGYQESHNNFISLCERIENWLAGEAQAQEI